jgi:excisionase family DNA binding protein
MYNESMEITTKKLLTVKEAALMLGVTTLTLRNWDNKGKLQASRHPFNNYRVYKRDDIEKLLTEIETNKERRPTRKGPKKILVRHE